MIDWQIITLDGGDDHLLLGRWKAFLNHHQKYEGHGITEEAAVEDLKQTLRIVTRKEAHT